MNVMRKIGVRREEVTAVKDKRSKPVVPRSYERARFD